MYIQCMYSNFKKHHKDFPQELFLLNIFIVMDNPAV